MAGIVIEPDDIDWALYESATDAQSKVHSAAVYRDEVIQALLNPLASSGDALPWSKTHADIRLRKGEVSAWAGMNGHGKSLLLGQVILGQMSKRRCLIASFEMKPRTTLMRMLRQVSCGPKPTEGFASGFFDWAENKLWLYDQQGTVDPARVMAVLRYGHQELGVEHFVIDSLMKCVRGEDDYNGQKNFIDELTAFARDSQTHVHLVHHVRKKEDENRPSGKYDLKGSGAITDQVDNVFIVWRNKRKAEALRCGEAVDPAEPDALLICEKQRNGDGDDNEGRYKLWFDDDSWQYITRPDANKYDFIRGIA